jgi:hypothetical protein
MTLSKKLQEEFTAMAGVTNNQLDLSDFKFDKSLGYCTHPGGHKMSKLTYVGLRSLQEAGVEYTLVVPKEGQEWARAWF